VLHFHSIGLGLRYDITQTPCFAFRISLPRIDSAKPTGVAVGLMNNNLGDGGGRSNYQHWRLR
jgi:hypothetical protein